MLRPGGHDRGSRLRVQFRTVIAASAHALAYMAGKQEPLLIPPDGYIRWRGPLADLEQPLTSYLQQMWARFPAASENWAAMAEME